MVGALPPNKCTTTSQKCSNNFLKYYKYITLLSVEAKAYFNSLSLVIKSKCLFAIAFTDSTPPNLSINGTFWILASKILAIHKYLNLPLPFSSYPKTFIPIPTAAAIATAATTTLLFDKKSWIFYIDIIFI